MIFPSYASNWQLSSGGHINKRSIFVTGVYSIGIVKSCQKCQKQAQNQSVICDGRGKSNVQVHFAASRQDSKIFLTVVIKLIMVIK